MSVNLNVDTYSGTYGSEYTSQTTSSYYTSALASIIAIGESNSIQMTVDTAIQMQSLLAQLTDLAQGLKPGTTTPLDLPLTGGMARVVDALIKSLRATGATVGVGVQNTISLPQLQQWHDLYLQGINSVLASGVAVGGSAGTYSVQSLIELEYIKAGNDAISTQLTQLQDAMQLTQKVAALLTDLQHLKDKVTTELRSTQGSVFGASSAFTLSFFSGAYNAGTIGTITAAKFPADYHNVFKVYFSNALGITLSDTAPSGISAIVSEGNSLKAQLNTLISQVALVIPRTADKTGLTDRLDQISTDMSGTTGVIGWILDNYGPGNLNNPNIPTAGQDTTKAGNFQKNLTQAVTTAENLNDTQNTNLKTALFNFQQFYQSAGNLLSTLNRIIQNMAQQISK